jgi:signal recognition particle subunit SRP72
MSSRKVNLSDLLGQLNIHSSEESHEKVLELAKQVLDLSPADNSARHSKLVALIKLDRFQEALKFLKSDASLPGIFPLEHCYVLYKLDRLDELVTVTGTLSEVHRGIAHALAQAYYKDEQLESAQEIYETHLTGIRAVEEHSDITVNQAAVNSLQFLNGDSSAFKADWTSDTDSYDQLFNKATGLIGQGKYSQALEFLRDAKLACENASFLTTPQEVADELAPILVQAAYANQRLGNNDEAISILKSIGLPEFANLSDDLVKQVALNNWLSLHESPNNPNSTLVDLEKTVDKRFDERAVMLQKEVLHRNNLVLQSLAGRDISSAASKFVKTHPSHVGIKAIAVLSKFDEEDAVRTKLLATFNKNPHSLPVALILAQLYVQKNNFDSAANILETTFEAQTDPAQKYLPGLVGALVSVFRVQNRRSAASKLVSDAFSHWKGSNTMFQYPAAVLAESDDADARAGALEYFKRALPETPNSTALAAGWLSTGATEAVRSYEQVLKTLPSIEELTAEVDVKSLNENGVHHLLKRGPEITSVPKGKQRKRSRSKPAKDTSKEADPERWLPLRDRSTYKPKKRDRKNAASATQGGGADTTTESGIAQPTSQVIQSKAPKTKKKKPRR